MRWLQYNRSILNENCNITTLAQLYVMVGREWKVNVLGILGTCMWCMSVKIFYTKM